MRKADQKDSKPVHKMGKRIIFTKNGPPNHPALTENPRNDPISRQNQIKKPNNLSNRSKSDGIEKLQYNPDDKSSP
jgi:hypothetical protein